MEKEYQKISNVFKFDEKNRTIIGLNEPYETLKNIIWQGTEKIDGTNIRIHWDGHDIEIAGHTDKAQIPTKLKQYLENLFLTPEMEYVFEQIFAEKEAYIFGEGYGTGIQKYGEDYLEGDEEVGFIIFDINIAGFDLKREAVDDIASRLGIKSVPVVFEGTLDEAKNFVAAHQISTLNSGKHEMEGIVLVPKGVQLYDNKKHLIVSFLGNNSILENKHQPGSLIKPILVYAPAIEKGTISSATKILDNKINISGYTPENSDKTYHGYISAKTALSKSYNIPAVKIMNELGINECKSFAKNLGIEFEKSDNHLALALGGFETGVTPKTICDAYSAFANSGKFVKSSFIQKITKNGKTIYEKQNTEKQVMNDSTAFLINDMLSECAKTGTAKRLATLPFEVCSKTGTVGKSNSKNNLLAYNISYTPEHTILTIIQGDNLPSNINGSTHPTMINKELLTQLYKNTYPTKFKKPNSVKLISLSKEDYLENRIVVDKNESELKEYFSIENSPEITEDEFKLLAINSKNHQPILCFTINKKYNYFLIRTHKNKEEIIFSSLENDNKFINFTDKSAKNNKIYSYKLKICEKSKNEGFFSNEIILHTY